jgi:hypothetical protein
MSPRTRRLRQEEPPRALGADSFVDRRPLGGAEIVHDDDVAMLQGRRKNLLDIGQKAFAVISSHRKAARNVIVFQ